MGILNSFRRPVARVFAAIGLFAFFACGCGCGGAGPALRIVSYNVLTLFDAHDDGGEFPEFSVAKGSWGEDGYRARLAILKKTIEAAGKATGGGLPEIVALQEIEGSTVIADLAALFPGSGYAAYAAPAPLCATTVGLLARLPVKAVRAHGSNGAGGEAGAVLRPILEVEVETAGGPLILFVNHWKSRIEGRARTEGARLSQALLLAGLIRERVSERPEAAVAACGDFNADPEEGDEGLAAAGDDRPQRALGLLASNRTYGAGLACAIAAAGDPAECAAWNAEGRGRALALGSPWLLADPRSGLRPEGASYAYRDAWQRIDHFFLCPGLMDGKALDFDSFQALRSDFLLDQRGFPRPWSRKDPAGASDHLPIVLSLRTLPPDGPALQ